MTHDDNPSDHLPPPIVRARHTTPLHKDAVADQLADDLQSYYQRVCAEALVYSASHQTENMDVLEAWEWFKLLPSALLDCLYTVGGWEYLIGNLRYVMDLDGPQPRVTVH